MAVRSVVGSSTQTNLTDYLLKTHFEILISYHSVYQMCPLFLINQVTTLILLSQVSAPFCLETHCPSQPLLVLFIPLSNTAKGIFTLECHVRCQDFLVLDIMIHALPFPCISSDDSCLLELLT
jgi:hypothetical protein